MSIMYRAHISMRRPCILCRYKISTMFLGILLCLLAITTTESAKILGVFPMSATSHYILGSAYMKELAKRGHDVTIISPFSENPPVAGSYREIVLTGFVKQMEEKRAELFSLAAKLPVMNVLYMNFMGHELTNKTFQHPNVQKLLKSGETFDVVVVEQFLNDAHKYFAHHFKAPLIVFSTGGANFWIHPLVGNPDPPAATPHVLLNLPRRMNFLERLQNSLFQLYTTLNSHLLFIPGQNRLLKENFPHAPHLSELLYNASLVLLNSHVSVMAPVPLVPNMIEIGGFHIKPPKELPKDLKQFLDNAKHGVIYFSMGSNLRSNEIEQEKLNALIKVFSELKQQVLFKWEADELPNRPSNMKVGKWFPQQDILVHPNVKLFITHGGLLSTTETIYHGVPILAIPVFGDQQFNAQNAVNGEYGVAVRYQDFTEAKFREAVNEVLQNPKFALNAKKRCALMHDRPMKPMDTAVFWTEYVIRHQGASHLRVAALDLAWYQYLLLDVSLFIVTVCALFLIVLFKIVKLFRRSNKKKQIGKLKKRL